MQTVRMQAAKMFLLSAPPSCSLQVCRFAARSTGLQPRTARLYLFRYRDGRRRFNVEGRDEPDLRAHRPTGPRRERPAKTAESGACALCGVERMGSVWQDWMIR